MSVIEIIIALVIVGLFLYMINWIIGLFGFLPGSVMSFIVLMVFVKVILFVIHRKD